MEHYHCGIQQARGGNQQVGIITHRPNVVVRAVDTAYEEVPKCCQPLRIGIPPVFVLLVGKGQLEHIRIQEARSAF